MINFYELLGVKENATKQEIKKAYHEMVKKYHPDVNGSEEANRIIRSLNEAKEILLNDDKRKEYDAVLNSIKHSKQFSKNKNETYGAKVDEYKEMYEDVYVTRWQYFMNFWQYAKNNLFTKFLKGLLICINFFIFLVLKCICFGLVFLVLWAGKFVDIFAGLLLIMAILSLFMPDNSSYTNLIPFLPANIENFCMFSVMAGVLEFVKNLILNGSVNLYAIIQDIEDRIFIFILMK